MSQEQQPEQAVDLIDRLVAEYADRLASGEDPRRAQLLARAGEHAAELERCLAVLEELEGPSHDATSGQGTLPSPVSSGLVLGDFRLGPVLGRGGMGVVYEAEQMSLGRKVALKVLRQHLTLDGRSLQRFEREARSAAKLHHEHVVPIHAVGQADGQAFIAFELVPPRTDGTCATLGTLIEELAALGRTPTPADLASASGRSELAAASSYVAACAQLLSGVFEAVAHAHDKGVIHRDLKPSNVLLTPEGKALVSDFGLAKDMGEATLSLTGEALGTPHYMSPEQAQALRDRVDERTDIYSLGVILYELIALRRPFQGSTFAQLLQSIVREQPPALKSLVPHLPQTVCDVIHRALAKERDARYATVTDLVADLRRALDGGAVEAPPTRGLEAMFRGWVEAERDGSSFEYRTSGGILGLPWIHIALRVKDPSTGRVRWARGVIAVGDVAIGVYAAGKVAIGFLCLGVFSFGVLALGAMAAGLQTLGGVVFGWNAKGLMAAGYSGRGMLDGWFVSGAEVASSSPALGSGSSDPFLVTVVGIVLCFTVIPVNYAPLCKTEADRRLLRRVTRSWMPLAFALPVGLHFAGVELPFMAQLLILMGITLAFSLFLKRRFRAGR